MTGASVLAGHPEDVLVIVHADGRPVPSVVVARPADDRRGVERPGDAAVGGAHRAPAARDGASSPVNEMTSPAVAEHMSSSSGLIEPYLR